jgi:DNA repair exonuclease SbcCD ATPase subunit/DNA repair exonuclease SbcCD nuclease subunit
MKKEEYVIFTGDWHIGISNDSWMVEDKNHGLLPSKVQETFRNVRKIIDCAKKYNAKIIGAGDLFDTPYPPEKYRRMFIEECNYIEDNGIEFDIFKGNHEEAIISENGLSAFGSIKYKHVNVFHEITAIKYGGINFIYVPHINKKRLGKELSDKEVSLELKKRIKPLLSTKLKNVLVGHYHAAGAVTGSEQHNLRGGINSLEVKDKKIHKVFLQHIHKQQTFFQNKIPHYYSGSIVRTDFGETEEKGFYLYNTRTDKAKFIKLPTTEYKTIKIDFVTKTTVNLNKAKIKKAASGKVLKLVVNTTDKNKPLVNRREITSAFSEFGYVSKFEIDVKKKSAEKVKASEQLSDRDVIKAYISDLGIPKEKKRELFELAMKVFEESKKEKKSVLFNVNDLKLKYIDIECFRSFEKESLELEGDSLIGIVGEFVGNPDKSNGSGKTTLIMSILWALFGVYGKVKNKRLMSHGKKKAKVALTFESGKNKIEVIRTQTKSAGDLDLIYNGESIADRKTKVTQEMINEMLGMDYDLFVAIVFFLQKDADQFCSANAPDRKEYLRKVCNLQNYDYAFDKVKNLMRENINEMEKSEASLETLQESVQGVSVTDLKQEISKDEKRIKTNKKTISELELEIKDHQEIISEYEAAEENKSDVEEEIEVEEEKVKTKKRNIKQFSDIIENFDESEYQKKEKSFKDAATESQSLKNQIAAEESTLSFYKKAIRDMNSLSGKCDKCHQKIPPAHRKNIVDTSKKNCEDIQKKINEREDRVEVLRKIGKKLKEELPKLRETRSRLDVYRKNIKDQKKDLIAAEKELKKLKKEMKEINESLDVDIDEVENLLETDGKKLSKIKKEQENLLRTLGENKNALETHQKNRLKIKKLQAKIKSGHNKTYLLNACKSVFDKNGASVMVIERYLDIIEKNSNEIMGNIDGGKKSIEFRTSKENSKGELASSLDIVVIDACGNEQFYEEYSGGQEVIINLAIRLGIAEMLTSLNNISNDMIILDEVFSELDVHNRQMVIPVINYLQNYYNLIMVVSHTDLKDAFASLFQVLYNEETGVSKVAA